ncbi:MAG: Holliday junction resolvase RuvX [Chloroflexota bacterium]|nr:MAG: Holliday junction resolvase RuvX [Chloroflexota bacterium]
MSILGIDYGEKFLGLAIGFKNQISHPLKVVLYRNFDHIISQLKPILKEYEVKSLVLGLPLEDGKIKESAKKVKNFGAFLEEKLGLKVFYSDETLTSSDAVALMIKSGVPQKKRKFLEHAFAAKIILDNYLQNIQNKQKTAKL